jgi:anti-sigma regulatory factor (Ser/Thr protein kinase)
VEAVNQDAHLLFPVVHPEDVGAVRRSVAQIAGAKHVDAAVVAQVELVVTELATNLLHHADPGGCILARVVAGSRGAGVEVLSVDQGPGIRDVRAALDGVAESRDGLGCGLAAVRRLATVFDLYTNPDSGTVVMARFLPGGVANVQRWSGLSVALDGAADCGDAWAIAEDDVRTTVLVVDGLGHGDRAAEAAQAAVAAFAERRDDDLQALARHIHVGMHSTRGGAVALCRLDPQRRRADYVGVGNVAGRLLYGGRSQAMVSLNGTLGTDFVAPRIRALSYDLDDGAALVMCSDGVRDGFDLAAHPGLLEHDPLVVAAVIHRDCRRGNDDATVVVVRPVAEVAA